MEEMGCVAQEPKKKRERSGFIVFQFISCSTICSTLHIQKYTNIIIIFKYYYGLKNEFRHHKAENVPFPFSISTVPNNNNMLYHMSVALFYGPIKQMNSAHVEFCVHQLVFRHCASDV